MKKLLLRHYQHWKQKQFISSMLVGTLLLVGSLVLNQFAHAYAIREAGNAVSDIILDNIRPFNVELILNEGVMIAIGLLILTLIMEPKRIPFVIKSLALFILLRSIFVSLTHLGVPLGRSYMDPTETMYKLSYGSDLFFSGHTGMPFLLSLIFWDNKIARYVGLAITVTFGTAVILGHYHYSIDVLAAFFITYTIYRIAAFLFPNDYKRTKALDGLSHHKL